MNRVSRPAVVCTLLLTLSLVLTVAIRFVPLALLATGDIAAGVPQSERTARAQQMRSAFSYVGADGVERPYLGGLDSYLWLRHARTLLRTGTPCDEIVEGVCRDTQTNAPVGAATYYARSLHVAAIAGLHRVITTFRPDYPLPATAFLVPVVAALLGVLPAFFVGRMLAGNVAGPFAVVLTLLHPVVLARSIGSDNDIWNVVLPLYALWAILAALGANGARRQSVFAAAAALCIGLQAWAWRGWPFSYAVLLIGLLAALAFCAALACARQRTIRIRQAPEVRRFAVVVVVFYLAAGAFTTLAGSDERYFALPAKGIAKVLPAADAPADAADEPAWPSALTRVRELVPMPLPAMTRAMGGGGVLLAAAAGLALLFVARADQRRTSMQRGAAFILTIWAGAAIYAAYDGVRFALLIAPPIGLACAVAAGRVYDFVVRLVIDEPRWYRATVHAVLVGLLAIALLQPLVRGYATARNYTPAMHDAWWDALARLRDTAPRDAIVHTWWDYGHWVKYVAERRVSNDGSSLLTHIPYWIGRALASPDETESAGVLRMLGCGSDATPLAEGRLGAYGKLRAAGRDTLTALATISSLAVRDAANADMYLKERGFADAARADILRSTHCDPPESYVVLTNGLVPKRRTWMAFGLWDPRRAADATVDVPFVPRWFPCVPDTGNDVRCEFHSTVGPGVGVLETFVYNVDNLDAARLRRRLREDSAIAETEATLVVAGRDRLRAVEASGAGERLGVLIDVVNQRVLVGAPSFLRSTYVQLMYLDGRYASHFEKVDDRTAVDERVVSWRVRW